MEGKERLGIVTEIKCPECKGTGVAGKQAPKRFTSGGKDEPVPCPKCFGLGYMTEAGR